MRVLRKMCAVAGALLPSPVLGMADDSAARIAGPQAASEARQARQAMQATQTWPQMMPMGDAPA